MMSIRRQLLLGLLCATLLCAGGASLLLYRALLEETNELADLQLRQLTAALPDEFALNPALATDDDSDDQFVVQAWDAGGIQLFASRQHDLLPHFGVRGFALRTFGGQQWRIYGAARRDGYIQAAQPLAARDLLAAEMAWHASVPLVIFLVLLAVLIVAVVSRALRPLDRLADAVSGRSANALEPVGTDGMPPELLPVVSALNGLLAKFGAALATQRMFVADAAHELRSLLTALKLQLQLLERAGNDDGRADALRKLHERLDRSTHLVEQLLSLARHEAAPGHITSKEVDLLDLLYEGLTDYGTLADSRGIDLGIEPGTDADPVSRRPVVRGDLNALKVLLNNLIDNAVRYTQKGGRVDLVAGLDGDVPYLQVRDNGPGVPAAYHDRLFDRFFRMEGAPVGGCGLGLSIVRHIAEQHGARIEVGGANDGRGLCVTLRFPPVA